ncbi:YccF domain-containing protein, partial [Faecalibaculum rodentium]
FKFASFVAFPFGKTIVYSGGGVSFLMNLLWLIFGGLEMALGNVLNGLALCVTIIGIPLGLQCFKFAKLALMPFGAQVVSSK